MASTKAFTLSVHSLRSNRKCSKVALSLMFRLKDSAAHAVENLFSDANWRRVSEKFQCSTVPAGDRGRNELRIETLQRNDAAVDHSHFCWAIPLKTCESRPAQSVLGQIERLNIVPSLFCTPSKRFES